VKPPERRNEIALKIFWIRLLMVIGAILTIYIAIHCVIVSQNKIVAPIRNFDKMVITDSFQKISLHNGQHFTLSYEPHLNREFIGVVRHTSMDHVTNFPIISFDILITSGDFSNPSLITPFYSNHTFTWFRLTKIHPHGTINLLHTVPINQKVEKKLKRIKEGDTVIVKGWDILRIDSYGRNGMYVGYWQDSGCNTFLVTDVTIQ
jgi:hypothetical protein